MADADTTDEYSNTFNAWNAVSRAYLTVSKALSSNNLLADDEARLRKVFANLARQQAVLKERIKAMDDAAAAPKTAELADVKAVEGLVSAVSQLTQASIVTSGLITAAGQVLEAATKVTKTEA